MFAKKKIIQLYGQNNDCEDTLKDTNISKDQFNMIYKGKISAGVSRSTKSSRSVRSRQSYSSMTSSAREGDGSASSSSDQQQYIEIEDREGDESNRVTHSFDPTTHHTVNRRKVQRRQANRKSAQLSRARKKAELEYLLRQNERLRRVTGIIESHPDIIFSTTRSGSITFISERAHRLVNVREEGCPDGPFHVRHILEPSSVNTFFEALRTLSQQYIDSNGNAELEAMNRVFETTLKVSFTSKDGTPVPAMMRCARLIPSSSDIDSRLGSECDLQNYLEGEQLQAKQHTAKNSTKRPRSPPLQPSSSTVSAPILASSFISSSRSHSSSSSSSSSASANVARDDTRATRASRASARMASRSVVAPLEKEDDTGKRAIVGGDGIGSNSDRSNSTQSIDSRSSSRESTGGHNSQHMPEIKCIATIAGEGATEDVSSYSDNSSNDPDKHHDDIQKEMTSKLEFVCNLRPLTCLTSLLGLDLVKGDEEFPAESTSPCEENSTNSSIKTRSSQSDSVTLDKTSSEGIGH